eukprot:TRINITY_DN1978_c0_g1_i1.p1 TRINITY_DN1978_c0_g1~~TRINITY_DN1978_c0_g1_i1.p1  ORF type:complete len:188 (-),score=52.05 TRINITY_DN1978_c0_g1_i1:52-615(-)
MEETINRTTIQFPIRPIINGQEVPSSSLSLSVDGPVNVTPNLQKRGESLMVVFETTSTGVYKVSVTSGGEHIQNSPMNVSVGKKKDGETPKKETQLPPVFTSPIVFDVEALDEDEKSIPASDDSGVSLDVESPVPISNKSFKRTADGKKYTVRFETAATEGQFVVSLKHQGKDILNSPFTVTLSKKT